ncbi:hypothetical protein FRB99_008114 [Tulasnella sp. 403]|nr:hypothetical protein FRB99_008114 [Tulasnella sp. 403]
MDGTLIKPQSGARFPKDFSDWKWWADGDIIPKKLKELHDDGFAIVIVSNQSLSGIFKDPKKREPKFEKIGKKLPLIAAKIPSVPFRIFAATEKDQYRKPITGTWLELERLFRKDGVEIDLASSFYVGDAAGRPGDHHVSDRLYALNVGIPFYTPEEFFLKKSPRKFTLRGFHPSSLTSDPAASLSTSSPFVPPNPTSPEIVLFVGYPSVGKTSFYKKHFAPAGYVHVNQDKLKSKPNCLKAVREAIKAKTGCVVDNTNRDLNTRAEYHAMAKELRVPIRAIYFETKLELAWHINLYRAFWLAESKKANEDVRTLVPYNVYTNFQNALQPPTLEEGFSEVRTVDWVFEGSEEDRRRFNMYLDIF